MDGLYQSVSEYQCLQLSASVSICLIKIFARQTLPVSATNITVMSHIYLHNQLVT